MGSIPGWGFKILRKSHNVTKTTTRTTHTKKNTPRWWTCFRFTSYKVQNWANLVYAVKNQDDDYSWNSSVGNTGLSLPLLFVYSVFYLHQYGPMYIDFTFPVIVLHCLF